MSPPRVRVGGALHSQVCPQPSPAHAPGTLSLSPGHSPSSRPGQRPRAARQPGLVPGGGSSLFSAWRHTQPGPRARRKHELQAVRGSDHRAPSCLPAPPHPSPPHPTGAGQGGFQRVLTRGWEGPGQSSLFSVLGSSLTLAFRIPGGLGRARGGAAAGSRPDAVCRPAHSAARGLSRGAGRDMEAGSNA